MNKKTNQRRSKRRKHIVAHHRVRRALLVGAGLILVSAAILLLRPQPYRVPEDFVPQVEGAPSIAVVSDPVIDHGNLIVNRNVTSSFEIQNVGDETLVIVTPWVEVHEGCCPPQAEIGNKQLRPGEITTVSMTYMMHPGMDGPHDLRIHLRSTDPSNPEIELTALSNWVSS
ncbi:MAG: DUF1573 domain-containing protein [Anaerolineae bacterium]|nr:DUF1573 domain-containing protein [Anaerolineae bacterium]